MQLTSFPSAAGGSRPATTRSMYLRVVVEDRLQQHRKSLRLHVPAEVSAVADCGR